MRPDSATATQASRTHASRTHGSGRCGGVPRAARLPLPTPLPPSHSHPPPRRPTAHVTPLSFLTRFPTRLQLLRADTTTAAARTQTSGDKQLPTPGKFSPRPPISNSRAPGGGDCEQRRSRLDPSAAGIVEERKGIGFGAECGGERGIGGDGAAVPDAPGRKRLQLQALQHPPRPRRRHHLQGPSRYPPSLLPLRVCPSAA